jgi:hypothetical protein
MKKTFVLLFVSVAFATALCAQSTTTVESFITQPTTNKVDSFIKRNIGHAENYMELSKFYLDAIFNNAEKHPTRGKGALLGFKSLTLLSRFDYHWQIKRALTADKFEAIVVSERKGNIASQYARILPDGEIEYVLVSTEVKPPKEEKPTKEGKSTKKEKPITKETEITLVWVRSKDMPIAEIPVSLSFIRIHQQSQFEIISGR